MKRCFFIGLGNISERGLQEKMAAELERLASAENQIEFWFYAVNRPFLLMALRHCVMLMTKHPEKDIKIVRVYDAEKNEEDWYETGFNFIFPLCMVDRLIPAAVDAGSGKKNENWYMQQVNKVERWVIRQCDVIFAYYYPSLMATVNTQIDYARNAAAKTVVPLYSEAANAFVLEQIMELEDRSRTIFLMLIDGNTQKETGKAVGISVNRVGQIVHKAGHAILQTMQNQMGQAPEPKLARRCAIMGLTGEATERRLVIFESLLWHLSYYYGVTEFWIDMQCCDTAYGDILARYTAAPSLQADTKKSKVFLSLPEEDNGEWEAAVEKYLPEFTSVLNISAGNQGWPDLFREVIRQCDCFIAEPATPEGQLIQDLCAKKNHAVLFDITRHPVSIPGAS